MRRAGGYSWFLFFTVASLGHAAEKPYNLLIIQTDEHHYGTLGCYGGRIVETPYIDSLAKRGVLCTSFYATTPVCSQSRAALVSGLYPQKTPVVTNNIPLHDSVITFAELLRRRGYATGFAGKWHLDGSPASRNGRRGGSSVLKTTASCSTAGIGRSLRIPPMVPASPPGM